MPIWHQATVTTSEGAAASALTVPADRAPVPATRKPPASAKASRKAGKSDDDDLKDIEDILRKRGI
jgi:hypothetical protein